MLLFSLLVISCLRFEGEFAAWTKFVDEAKRHARIHGHVSGLWAYQGSKPFVWRGRLYSAVGDTLHCADPRTQEVFWKKHLYDRSEEAEVLDNLLTPPAVVNGKLFVGTMLGEICCLSAEAGEVIWRDALDEPVMLLELHRHHLGTSMRNAGREDSLYRGTLPETTSAALAAQLLGHFTRPSEAAVRAEIKIRLQEALNSMEALDREVLALRHFEQLTTAEAAQVLGIKPKAAGKRYLRALERLKAILSNMPGGLGEFRR